MPGAVGILTFMSRKNSGRGLSAPEENLISWYFYTYDHLKFHAQLTAEHEKSRVELSMRNVLKSRAQFFISKLDTEDSRITLIFPDLVFTFFSSSSNSEFFDKLFYSFTPPC